MIRINIKKDPILNALINVSFEVCTKTEFEKKYSFFYEYKYRMNTENSYIEIISDNFINLIKGKILYQSVLENDKKKIEIPFIGLKNKITNCIMEKFEENNKNISLPLLIEF